MRDELVDRMDWQCWIDHKNQSETSHASNWHKVLDRIVAQTSVYEWVGGQRRVGPHEERIAVCRLMMDVKRSQRSVRSRAIFDDNRLAEYRAELVRNDAANRVAPAARTKHVNDSERPRRIIVGIKRRTEQCGPSSHENEKQLFHAEFLPGHFTVQGKPAEGALMSAWTINCGR